VSHNPPGGRSREQARTHCSPADTLRAPGGVICPDCDAVGSDSEPPTIRHRTECPIGRGIDLAMAADRDYFATHPGIDTYERPLTWAERAQHDAFGAPPELLDGARVVVRAVALGVRVRTIILARRWAR
jgi:hypothetical protein